ncbi:MAG: endonuclease MutS2 [Anaerocolumna sp.]
MNKTTQILEFDHIKSLLCQNAMSEPAKENLSNLMPYLSLSEVVFKQRETSDAKIILESMGTPPLPSMKDIDKYIDYAEKGSMLTCEQLLFIAQYITSCKRVKNYLKKAQSINDSIATYGESIIDLTALSDEINICIRGNQVEDSASPLLKDVRRKLENIRADIKTRLNAMLRSKKEWFSESFVSSRGGHYVLPVKKEYKHQVNGSTLDISSTGSTYFIVPNSVLKLEEELNLLQIAEENEVRKILYTLTAMVYEEKSAICLNMEAITVLDIIFAKAKLSIDLKGIAPEMIKERSIQIINGRHPLIKPSECVPLNFTLGDGKKGVVITGPNTGGKTVSIKTVGLFALMAQCGLHLPCDEAKLCLFNEVFCDIGDGQSISENLSTFSSHISNIINILNYSDSESLIILDELGSGTDPLEGMGIAISILEELKEKNCLFLATTHYPEVKEYANRSETLVNARMAFDKVSLKPLYRLEIGEAGESCALYIAKRLGLPKRMLERAYEEAYSRSIGVTSREMDPSIFNDTNTTSDKSSPKSLQSILIETKDKTSVNKGSKFQIGDSVLVYPQKKIGIVYKTANEKGEIGVQIKKEKYLFSHKRLKLKASREDLYPPDYDFSIIFDSVATRKARHDMGRKHDPNLIISYDKEEL